MLKLVAMSLFVNQLRDKGGRKPTKQESLALLREFPESGKLIPYVDKAYPLGEVPEAISYLQEGHAKGKVVITI